MIRLRASERDALIEVLEQDFTDAAAAAAAVFTKAAELLQQRDTYGVQVAGDSPVPIAVGPFYSEGDAKKLVIALPESMNPRTATLYSPGVLLDRATQTPRDERFCALCGHPLFAHFPQQGCVVGQVRTKAGKTTQEGCGCRG